MNPAKPHRLTILPLLSVLTLSGVLYAAPPLPVNPMDQERDWQKKQQLQEKIDHELQAQRRRSAQHEHEQRELPRKTKVSDETQHTDPSPSDDQHK